MNGGTDRDSLVGVDTLARVSTEKTLDSLDNSGHSAHSSDQNDVVDLVGLHAGIGESLLARVNGPVHKRLDEGFEFSPREGRVDVLGTVSSGGDVGEGDVGLRGRRKLNLGSLGCFTNTLNGHPVLGQIDALRFLELADEVISKGDVEVFSSEVSITVCGFDLEHSLLHFQDRHIEGSSTQVVDGDD